MSLSELFPEFDERNNWISDHANLFNVSTLEPSEPDHPLIAVSFQAVDQDGEFTRAEAEQRVDELEKAGGTAWFTPTRDEFYRLLAEWESLNNI